MTASPLGRYAGDSTGPLHAVRLLNLPVRLLVDGRERHDSLLREFALLALGANEAGSRTRRLVEVTQLLGVHFGAAQPRQDEVVDDALRQGRDTVGLSFAVPASVAEDATRLEALMQEADELCRSEQLLTLPRTPLQARFAHWYVDELRRQVRGGEPRPWDGPLDA